MGVMDKMPGKKKEEAETNGEENGEQEKGGGDKAASALGAYDVTEHKMSHGEVADKLATSIDLENPTKSRGLTKEEVCARLLPGIAALSDNRLHCRPASSPAERCALRMPGLRGQCADWTSSCLMASASRSH